MKTCMVIPTYWERSVPKRGDLIYDHPTPLKEKGTLARLLESFKILENKDFETCIISVPTSPEIGEKVKNKVEEILEPFKNTYKIYHFSQPDLDRFKKRWGPVIPQYIPYFSLMGYSNVRNMCVIIPHILGAEVAILIDDDEVFEDPYFISKAREFIGKDELYGIGGCYIQPYGGYKFRGKKEWWKLFWDNTGAMNKIFSLIDEPGRFKETSFVGAGNMAIHRELFTKVPFDPYITRGEDADFLHNAKIEGFKFLLDTELSIRHLPPKGRNPVSFKLKEDIKRFVYMREKLKEEGFPIKKTMPYPGYFLRSDLYFRILFTNTLLAKLSLLKFNFKEAFNFLANIKVASQAKKGALSNYKKFQRLKNLWKGLMDWVGENRSAIKETIWIQE